jgi:hypothetical protein
MRVVIAVTVVAVAVLGWELSSTMRIVRRQEQRINELTAALADKSKQQALADQSECAASADKFLVSRGWKPDDYENHFNSRLNRCFVFVSGYRPKDDFRTSDLYDAVEGKRYASYNGHNICDPWITRNPQKCALDSGAIWFDGDDSKRPADFTAGFRGLLYGGGAGDEKTQKVFLDRVRQFMNQ